LFACSQWQWQTRFRFSIIMDLLANYGDDSDDDAGITKLPELKPTKAKKGGRKSTDATEAQTIVAEIAPHVDTTVCLFLSYIIKII
jgi:hypothetical protein